VYKSSSVARKTHNEELLPWILEDYETSKEWESRRKESRRGIKALQQGIKARREGGRFPSKAKGKEKEVEGVKKEEDGMDAEEEEKKLQVENAKENHAPWIGKLEGEAHESGSTSSGGAMSHALFIFDERDKGGFRVVPVERMYKFLQKPTYANNLSWEEAEKAVSGKTTI
jgi:transcription initiation factor TFIIF subunit alpha